MQYNASPRGHQLLAYNSARIYVIDVQRQEQGLEVQREFKLLRRPVSACINDQATLLAVLSTEMQIDLYDLRHKPPRRTRSIILDNTPRAIALSPCGSVLAAAYEGGIEVSSIKSDALPTDRRAVKCDSVDTLAFSFDGTQILGSTIQSPIPSTVIITAPYYDPGSHMSDDNLSPLWTTSILFPNTSRDCSHAVLLQDGSEEEASWSFTYDRSFETFRAVRIDDLRNGTTYFTGPVPSAPSQAKLLPSTLPAATYGSELVSAGFNGKDIWIYGVPEDLDAVPDPTTLASDASSSVRRQNSNQSGGSRRLSTRAQESEGSRVPQWQLLCDQQRNTFASGCKIAELTEVRSMKWVAGFGTSSSQERLVLTARGVGTARLVTEEEDMDFIDGGRVILLDFDYGLCNGTKAEITIEVGTDNAEVLEEERRDLATEVAIVRRRTVAQKRGGRGGGALLRAATATAASRAPAVPDMPSRNNDDDSDDDDPLLPRRKGQSSACRPSEPTHTEAGDELSIDEMEALDAPYAHASPRSQITLRRAATAAAVNRTLHPRTADGRRIEYRRADGRREHPHESDADNWVPPPPPYQKEDPGDLPAFLRGPSVAPLSTSVPAVPSLSTLPNSSASVSAHARPQDAAEQSDDEQTVASILQRPTFERITGDSTTVTRPREAPRPRSNPSSQQETDNIYDATPPDSPRQPARQNTQAALPSADNRQASSSSHVSSLEHDDSTPLESRTSVTPPFGAAAGTWSGSNANAQDSAASRQMTSAASSAVLDSGAFSGLRQLPSAQSWPRATRPETEPPSAQPDGFLFRDPASRSQEESLSGLPPLPSSSQMASLNKRISQGNPRRLSGGFNVHRRPIGDLNDSSYLSRSQPEPRRFGPSSLASPEFDQPLIISTPKGVSGAFDSPSRQTSSRRNETPLLAPVPRHPRPTQTSIQRPTVERLETIYSVASSHGANPTPGMLPGVHQQSVPAWLNAPPPASVARISPTVNRRPSRAERGAAKNIKDAKKRGWQARGKKKKKQNADAASSAGWTDVSTGSVIKEKEKKEGRCLVM